MTKSERKVTSEHIAHWTDQVKRGTAVVFGPVLDPKGAYGIGIIEIEDDADVLERSEVFPLPAKMTAVK